METPQHSDPDYGSSPTISIGEKSSYQTVNIKIVLIIFEKIRVPAHI